MINQNDIIHQTVRTNVPYENREMAMVALKQFTGHRIGQLITLLYRVDPQSENEKGDVHALLAVGIKNANECGASGLQSSDKWENKHYEDSPCGSEFFRIVGDSGERDIDGYIIPSDHEGQGTPSADEILSTMGVNYITVNGHEYNSISHDYDDKIVDDPFEFKSLN